MKSETFQSLTNLAGGWLDRSEIELLNVIRSDVDHWDPEDTGRPARLRAAQPQILSCIAPAMQRLHAEAITQLEGAIELRKAAGSEIGEEERQYSIAAQRITEILGQLRTGARVIDFDNVISGDFLLR